MQKTVGLFSAFVVAALAITSAQRYRLFASLPVEPAGSHPVETFHNLWTDEEIQELTRMVEGFGEIPSTVKDQTSRVNHIGEAMVRYSLLPLSFYLSIYLSPYMYVSHSLTKSPLLPSVSHMMASLTTAHSGRWIVRAFIDGKEQ